MAEPKVSVIIPTWNGLPDTLECLRSLQNHDYPFLHIVVVDNGSRDGTPERVREEFPEIDLMGNRRNLGFARACNTGARRALERGADYLMFLNNDATVDPGCVRELVAVAGERSDIGVVAVLARHAGDLSQIEAGHVVDWRTANIREVPAPAGETRAVPVDYAWGCGLLVPAGLFRCLEGFKEVYGSYYEDADFCIRAARMGYQTAIATRATIQHKVSRSGDRAFLRQTYLRARNLLLFFLMNCPRKYLVTALPICAGYRVPRFLYDSLHLYLAHRLRGRFPERSIALVERRSNRRTG